MISDDLKSIGVDYDSALRRFANNEELYHKYLKKFIHDDTYKALVVAIADNDVNNVGDQAHTYKGICGNLGFKKLYELADIVTVAARKRDADTIATAYKLLCEEHNRIVGGLALIME